MKTKSSKVKTEEMKQIVDEIKSGKYNSYRFKNVIDQMNQKHDLVVFSRRMINFDLNDFISRVKQERQLVLEVGKDVNVHTLFINRLESLKSAYDKGLETFILHYSFYQKIFGD